MKAILCKKYGPPDVLQLAEVASPTPEDNEILIKVIATNVFTGDCEMRRFDVHPSMWLPIRLFLGIRGPRRQILGQELSGEVVAIGKAVTRFKIGDQILGGTGSKFGSYAEYASLPENYALTIKPESISYDEAATIPVGGIHAVHFLRMGKLQRGEKILICGAGGCIGTYALQLAKIIGAEVTVVDSTDKLDMLRDLGADHIIDYSREDFSKNNIQYDVIFDVVGKSSYSQSLKSLRKNGRYLLANIGISVMLRALWTSKWSTKKVLFKFAEMTNKDLLYITELIAEGKIKAVVDKRFPLEQMADAHRYIETGGKKGHVVVSNAQ